MLVVMDLIVIYIALALFGLCLGSFAGASVWRIRARQLIKEKSDGEKVDEKEFKQLNKLTKHKINDDRSQCLNCSYTLKWYDLMPLVSWLILRGKCRKCKKSIGWMEPLVELGVAGAFVASFIFWPFGLSNGLEIARFILWLMSIVGLAILFIYDKKWFILPDIANFTVIGLGLASSIIVVLGSVDKISAIYSILGSLLILSGLYYVLFIISKGKWIGFGDIKLGLGLSLLLEDWKLAFIALFLANAIGCLLVIPFLVSGKLKRNSHIPFGPLLIIGSIIAMLAGYYLMNLCFYGLY